MARAVNRFCNLLSALSLLMASFGAPVCAFAPVDYQTQSRIFDSLQRAHGFIVADRFTEARPLLEYAAKFDPSDYSGTVHENLAIVYRELGYPEKGIMHAKLAQNFGGSPGTSYTLGLCYSDMGKFDQAIHWFELRIIYCR